MPTCHRVELRGDIRRREVEEMGCQKGSGEKGTSEEGKCRRWDVRRKEVEERRCQKKGSGGDGMSEGK